MIDRNELISRQFEDELSRVGFARVLSSSDGETTICWNAYSIQVIFQIKAHSVEVMSKLCLLEQDKLCVFKTSHNCVIALPVQDDDLSVLVSLTDIVTTTFAVIGSVKHSSCDGCSTFKKSGECLHMALIQRLVVARSNGSSVGLLRWLDMSQGLPKHEQRVIRLHSARVNLERFAVCLTPTESELHDVQLASVCYLRYEGKGKTVMFCSAARCSKSRFHKVNKGEVDSKMCAHCVELSVALKATGLLIELEDGWLQSSDDSANDALDEVNGDSSKVVSQGLMFSSSLNAWIPSEDCSRKPIPRFSDLTPIQLQIIQDRTTLNCVERDSDHRPILTSEGHLKGFPCFPRQCSQCFHELTLENAMEQRVTPRILILTRSGTVSRAKIRCKCPQCDLENDWDPSTELIHTIRHELYGGEKTRYIS